MKKKAIALVAAGLMAMSVFAGCGGGGGASNDSKSADQGAAVSIGKTSLADQNFDTNYEPKKKEYKIYVSYKVVHAWYDAIRAGVDAAVADLAAKGVKVDYEWYAPTTPDAVNQVNSIDTAVGQGYDFIAVDVNQPELATKAIDAAVAKGTKVGLFASADVPESKRIFFVGNTDNYADGAKLAEEVIKKMGGKGQIAILSGTMGALSHEQRLQAFKDVIAKYPDVELVAEERDNDFVENAVRITEAWLQAYPDLGGILCNNMSNPVGAAQAVKDAGKSGKIVIGGMDHDLRTLKFLEDGTIYIAQVQNCYDMGYKMVWNAVKTVDGEKVPEVTGVGSTSVFKDQAAEYIKMLFGNQG